MRPRADRGFADRRDAGRRLGEVLAASLGGRDADADATHATNPTDSAPGRGGAQGLVVLGLPRGGVVVAAEVAAALGAPLDVLVVRKLGVPGQRELAFGAVAGGTRVVNADVVRALRLEPAVMDAVAAGEQQVVERREAEYRGIRPAVPLAGRTAVLVDDGLATGATARAAVQALRARPHDRPARVVLAVPVAPRDTAAALRAEVDDLVCLLTPWWFGSVGEWYQDFAQVEDDEVRRLLSAAGPPPV